jgi:hypothetical protein
VRERIAAFTDPSAVRIDDVLEVLGDVSGIASGLTVAAPAVSLPAGLVSLLGTSLSLAQVQYSTDELLDLARARLGDLEFLHGRIVADRAALQAAIAAGPAAPEPAPPDPATLTDEALRAAPDAAQGRVMAALDRAAQGMDRLASLRRQDDGLASQVQAIRDRILRGDAPDTSAAGSASEVAGLESIFGEIGQKGLTARADAAGSDAGNLIRTAGSIGADEASLAPRIQQADDAIRTTRELAAGADYAGRVATVAGAGANALALYQWHLARVAEGARDSAQLAIAGHQFERGRLADAIDRAQGDVAASQHEAEVAAAQRRALSAEIDTRAANQGHLLWPE